jgi:hypothetical protein
MKPPSCLAQIGTSVFLAFLSAGMREVIDQDIVQENNVALYGPDGGLMYKFFWHHAMDWEGYASSC